MIFAKREAEATVFYEDLLPEADPQDMKILRQSLAGMIWCKQFFHFDVARWQDGDQLPPPDGRKQGRNRRWRHMKAADVISMPDTWEYPWFAQWDLAFHCGALALVDVDFAKDQIELLLTERYISPNGQVPAYEWSFDDVNPPVLAMAALKTFRAERVQRGKPDIGFLQRVTHKLLMNYTWWLNRKDADGNNVFEGGFLGLDNISVYDRSQPLPPGYSLKQADATGWVAMFALNMTLMCLELAASDSDYEDVAIQCYMQFLGIARTIAGGSGMGISLWDENDGFFKDVVVGPDGSAQRIDVFSWVGLIPLFACEIVDQRLLKAAPRFHAVMNAHRYGLFDGMYVSECPTKTNARGEHLLALVDAREAQARAAAPVVGERVPVRATACARCRASTPSDRTSATCTASAARSSSTFRANPHRVCSAATPTGAARSGCRPTTSWCRRSSATTASWATTSRCQVPCLGNQELTLNQVAKLISDRLVNMFRRGLDGRIPALPANSPFQRDPAWKDLLLFNEYFHGETGLGLGAMHQTGWTGLVANLVQRRYRTEIPAFWRGQQAEAKPAARDKAAAVVG